MSSSAKVPGLARAMVIEWRARQIADPLCRLQYLRSVAAPAGHRWFGRRTRRAWVLAWLLVPMVPARESVLVPAAVKQTASPPAVWLVEAAGDHESYSNGLRIDNRYAVTTRRRLYGVFERTGSKADSLQWRTDPAGIVYHATESDLAPLEPEHNVLLQRLDEALLEYVRRRHSYHFVIDRFGRVFRVVAEDNVANHAGHSIWADRQWLYCNLNAAFLGVAFEARTESGQDAPLSTAQIQAGRVLTDMLRSRYAIPAENCVAHAQVSVNPSNMEIGYHTDWASRFPFSAMGVGDNYRLPVASVLYCGFGYSQSLLDASGERPWPGLVAARQTIEGQAARLNLSSAGYMRRLQQSYRKKMAALHLQAASQESTDDQE